MKKRMMIRALVLLLAPAILILSLFACAGRPPASTTVTRNPHQTVEPVGTPPDELRRVAEENLFYNIVPFSDRMFKTTSGVNSSLELTGETTVTMMDLYGETLAERKIRLEQGHRIGALTATSDGGFLFVIGFFDYQIGPGINAGDNGFASRVVKCDAAGEVVFDTAIDQVDGSALMFCLERDGRYYLFGSYRKPENRPTYGETDVSVLVLSGTGEVVRSACIGGSDFDMFYGAELTEDGFLLQVQTQSTDGDFPISTGETVSVSKRMEVELDQDLTVKSFRPSERPYATYSARVGEKDGQPIYRGDPLFDGFDAGTPTAYLDYGEYYLIVSQNVIGEIETPPEVSARHYCTETVYSGYDREGNLLFRYAIFP